MGEGERERVGGRWEREGKREGEREREGGREKEGEREGVRDEGLLRKVVKISTDILCSLATNLSP